MGESIETRLEAPPHPTMGHIVVLPIPRPEEMGKDRSEDRRGPVINLGPAGVAIDMNRVIQDSSAGVRAGVVLEIGPKPENWPEEFVPYEEKSTVYYHEGNAIPISDFHYVHAQSVICWAPAPRD